MMVVSVMTTDDAAAASQAMAPAPKRMISMTTAAASQAMAWVSTMTTASIAMDPKTLVSIVSMTYLIPNH